MRYLPITLKSPGENLALDEALFNDRSDRGALRVWEPSSTAVVVGRATRVEEEVDLAACQQLGVPVLRRVSGGATIVTGPGCLMYAVTLPLAGDAHLQAVDTCHELALGPIAAAITRLVPSVHRAGTSDLAFRPTSNPHSLKFSGNSLRVTRGRMLYHGTLLYGFDLPLVGRLLRTPPRQPDYRASRPHAEFVANLPVERGELVQVLESAWPIEQTITEPPANLADAVAELTTQRYGNDAWNRSR